MCECVVVMRKRVIYFQVKNFECAQTSCSEVKGIILNTYTIMKEALI
jgi:hypothetical protein